MEWEIPLTKELREDIWVVCSETTTIRKISEQKKVASVSFKKKITIFLFTYLAIGLHPTYPE